MGTRPSARLPRAELLRRAVAHGLRHLRFSQVASDTRLEAFDEFETLFAVKTDAVERRIIRLADEACAVLDAGRGTVDLAVAARSAAQSDAAFENLVAALTPRSESPDSAPVTFWASDGRCVSCAHRRIATPAWDEISPNHAASTRNRLDDLMRSGPPAEGVGRLILWHGAPGTGKTHALKALVREWRDWCIPHFITDPDELLGQNAGYLMEVLTSGDAESRRNRDWRLVILEDSGELLSADARARTGQALSRLLNVTDGLLGQGMNALVLVTTNEPIARLHPAVSRPGRCWHETEFERLSADEANEWLEAAGSDERVATPRALTDLYALLAGRRSEAPVPVGFAP